MDILKKSNWKQECCPDTLYILEICNSQKKGK